MTLAAVSFTDKYNRDKILKNVFLIILLRYASYDSKIIDSRGPGCKKIQSKTNGIDGDKRLTVTVSKDNLQVVNDRREPIQKDDCHDGGSRPEPRPDKQDDNESNTCKTHTKKDDEEKQKQFARKVCRLGP